MSALKQESFDVHGGEGRKAEGTDLGRGPVFGWRARRMISGQASVGRTTFAALRQRRFEWLAVVA
jgi:hypothetical protein